MVVEAWEKRFVGAEDAAEGGHEVCLLEKCEEDANSWWAFHFDRQSREIRFAKLNLRRYQTVRREDNCWNIRYEQVIIPDTDEERTAILDMLHQYQQQLAGGDAGGGQAPAGAVDGGVPRRYIPRRVDAGAPRPGRYQRRRRPFFQRVREARPQNVAIGTGVFGGVSVKFYRFVVKVVAVLNSKIENKEDIGPYVNMTVEYVNYYKEYFFTAGSWVKWCYDGVRSDWDSFLLFLLFLYCLFQAFGGSLSSSQIGAMREEDRERDERDREERRRQHAEMMSAIRRQQDGGGGVGGLGLGGGAGAGGGGLGASLQNSATGFAAVASADAAPSSQTGIMVPKETLADRISRLVRRAKNPVDRVVFLLKRVRVIRPWLMPKDYDVRMSEEMVCDIYGNGGDAERDSLATRTEKQLIECNAWKPHFSISQIMDAFVLRDAELVPELLNTEGFERLCRWRYGLGMVFEEVKEQKHWKGDKSSLRTNWELLKEYHPSEKELGNRIASLDEEVAGKLKTKALFEKYLSKAYPK